MKAEIDILKFCRHDKIVEFIDHFENSEYIFIITEYIKYGDLQDYFINIYKKGEIVSEKKAAKITFQIASAL